MKDIFDKIIAKEVVAQYVYEDERCIVIMDKFPVVTGQVLIIPKEHVDYLFDLDDDTYVHLQTIMRRTVRALDSTYKTLRTCVVIEGFEVPHAHIKLYPLTTKDFQIHGGTMAEDVALDIKAEKIKLAFT